MDHCDAQWIPAFAGMTGTHDCVVIDLYLSFPRRRESIKARQSWNTRDLHHGQQTQRNALHIGVINNLKKRVSVARVPSVDTNRALISSRLYQSMCFNNLINSWPMSSLFSRRTLNRSSRGILGCFLFHFGLEVVDSDNKCDTCGCQARGGQLLTVVRFFSPKTKTYHYELSAVD